MFRKIRKPVSHGLHGDGIRSGDGATGGPNGLPRGFLAVPLGSVVVFTPSTSVFPHQNGWITDILPDGLM